MFIKEFRLIFLFLFSFLLFFFFFSFLCFNKITSSRKTEADLSMMILNDEDILKSYNIKSSYNHFTKNAFEHYQKMQHINTKSDLFFYKGNSSCESTYWFIKCTRHHDQKLTSKVINYKLQCCTWKHHHIKVNLLPPSRKLRLVLT